MRLRRALLLVAVGGAVVAVATGASAAGQGTLDLTNIAAANPKAQAFSQPNILSPQLQEVIWAQGSFKLDGGTAQVPYYGYDGNGPVHPDVLRRHERPHGYRGAEDRAGQEHLSRSRTACTAPTRATTTARTSSTRGTRRPHQESGPRSRGSTSTQTERTAPRCSRRRRRPACLCTRSTARRGTRGRRSCSSRPRAGTRAARTPSPRRRSTRRPPTIPRRSTTSRT